jgi:hypothetical protein
MALENKFELKPYASLPDPMYLDFIERNGEFEKLYTAIICLCMFVYIYICVCVCVCERERERVNGEGWGLWGLVLDVRVLTTIECPVDHATARRAEVSISPLTDASNVSSYSPRI